ncbi:lipid IV(A) 3-deoxy-D-manno-octulosonic acid transferase [Vibrio sp. 16]|uniref:lipid IV(A) 3-deoxy-D-manno-octulosonic acid transferase n=1 Tax=Vibrio sp. 16 TaxID=391586 RepID=UPI00018F24B6|nr:lipid IV(A) 3-deoxy-D-manno-octulosonic acid transferase [Vibrio sp. 16]EED27632.1 3-deoxy-D-manno-octulosonic-acid transferase [Vibrio sp. 16]CAK4070458.1 3-deoxy-D-manno-octulosonic acid transferase [Vibrio sp. 16]
MIRFLYTILLFLVSPILLFGLYKRKPGKPSFGPRWKEHFGITPKLKSQTSPIWIHAVSVGEVIAVTPIIKALKLQNPEKPIVVTTTTSTGAEQVEKLADLVEHRYMPIDFSFAVRGFLRSINPSKMLIMETELWPNTLHTVARNGITITVLNARLSEKSYRNYQKVHSLFDMLAKNLSHICCQYQDDADRFEKLGVEKSKVSVTGSVKFDISVPEETKQAGIQLRSQIGKSRPVWIAASTHKGEDERILAVHKELVEQHPDSLLILVPRHPERFDSVHDLCQQANFTVSRRTQGDVSIQSQIYLGDTMGEMLTLLGAADICFMGGSLLGDKVGGHNMLEPIALGVPVITGPSYFNFQEISEQLLAEGLMTVCSSELEIANGVLKTWDNTALEGLQERMNEFMVRHQGCIDKTLKLI